MIVQDMRRRDAPPRLIGVRDTGLGGGGVSCELRVASCELRGCSDESLGSPREDVIRIEGDTGKWLLRP